MNPYLPQLDDEISRYTHNRAKEKQVRLRRQLLIIQVVLWSCFAVAIYLLFTGGK